MMPTTKITPMRVVPKLCYVQIVLSMLAMALAFVLMLLLWLGILLFTEWLSLAAIYTTAYLLAWVNHGELLPKLRIIKARIIKTREYIKSGHYQIAQCWRMSEHSHD